MLLLPCSSEELPRHCDLWDMRCVWHPTEVSERAHLIPYALDMPAAVAHYWIPMAEDEGFAFAPDLCLPRTNPCLRDSKGSKRDYGMLYCKRMDILWRRSCHKFKSKK